MKQRNNTFIYSILFLLHLWLAPALRSQASAIGGVINIYTPVTAIQCNEISVGSSAGFSAGDRILVIQMQGATLDSTNTSAFGSVISYNNCGNYEFATIASITGNIISTQFSLLKSYSVPGRVQVIRVPQYVNANVTSSLGCQAWNGTTGGVLVLEVSNTLSLNADIDVSGKGFRGGTLCTNPDGACGAGYPDYYYAVSSNYGAEKGEGISIFAVNRNGGRGAWGNGGGGGNKHNSGGGGGSNYTAGGVGGKQANFCPPDTVGGKGGYALNYALGKIFCGGGGGCSDNNNGVGTTGGNGGGICIIKSNSISGNGFAIRSDGVNVPVIPNTIGDGAGGGGGGGALLMNINSFTGPLTLSANGGHGGDQNANYYACFGPGGGGGTGIIYYSLPSAPVGITNSTLPGDAGMDLGSISPCLNTTYGAAPGQAANATLFNLVLPESTAPALNAGINAQTNESCFNSNDASASISASGGAGALSFLWTPTGGTSSSISGVQAGNYTCTVSDNAGCSKTINVTLTSPPAINYSVTSTNATCNNSDGSISISANGGTGTLSYTWSTGAGGTSTLTNLPVGNYSCTITDSLSCTVTLTASVQNTNGPTASAGANNPVCEGQTVFLNASGGTSYSWAGPAGFSSSTQNPVLNSALPAQSGIYTVTVSNASACSDTATVSVTINPTPFVTINYSGNDTLYEGETLVLTASGANSYNWNTGATGSAISVTPAAGTYTYCATGTTSGCSSQDCETIYVIKLECGEIFVPDAFSPNADGANDQLCIYGTKCFKEMRFMLFDRWGEKVFDTADANFCWDGTYKGKNLNPGKFAYALTATLINNESVKLTGDVLLIR
jgi:gliding motility-associated-like protein